MNEILNNWQFIEPEHYLDILSDAEEIPKEWIKLFYIGRCLFADQTSYPIKGLLSELFERDNPFLKEDFKKQRTYSDKIFKLNYSDSVDIGRISSLQQISYILPREFLINSEEIFLKKLTNKELYKKEFVDCEGISVSDLVYGKEKDLNRRQKVYILFDNSSSMNGDDLNKLFASKYICLEYLRRVQRESPQIYFRYFNQDLGPLIKIKQEKQIKELIKYIININTFDCFKTRIGDALLNAIDDIKGDTELCQAEILIMTDGLGDVPTDIEQKLDKIKLHMILISDLNTDKLLKLFPNKKTFEDGLFKIYNQLNYNKEEALQQIYCKLGINDMNAFTESIAKLPQIYRLQDIAHTFIKIDSLWGEKFKFTNPYELELIKNLRVEMNKQLKSSISGNEKYKIYQRIKFVLRYLEVILSKTSSKELKEKIKREIDAFKVLLMGFKEDEWFISTIKTLNAKKTKVRRKKAKDPITSLTKSNRSRIILLMLYIRDTLSNIYKKNKYRLWKFNDNLHNFFITSYRKIKLRRRCNYIDKKIYQILKD